MDKGELTIVEPLDPLTGKLWVHGPSKQIFDVIGCKHCGAAIKIVRVGINKASDTKYRCSKCHGPMCRYCAEELGGANGHCMPQAAQVDYAQRTLTHRPLYEGILDYRDPRFRG